MDQPTQATSPKPIRTEDQRAAYKRASALADRIVDRLTVMPRDVEARGEFGGTYGLRVHFGTGLPAGRGVLAVAGIADAEPTRDTSDSGLGVYVECRAEVDGIHLIARALLTPDDADQLLQQTPTAALTVPEATPPTPAAPAAQPVPLGASVLAQISGIPPVGGDL